MRFQSLAFACCLLPVFHVGCVSRQVDQQLAESSAAREKDFKSLFDRIESEPQKRISWKDARRRMENDNLGIQQSRKMLEDSERLTQRQWLTLVPRAAAFVKVSQSIGSITNFESDDLNANLVANFNIPNPFDFYASLYGAALQEQNARWSSELDQRRAFTELYNAYLDAELLREEAAALIKRQQSLWSDTSADMVKALKALAMQKASLKQRRLTHRGNVNRLFNTPGDNWELVGDDLPDLSYRKRYRTMKIGRDFGKLALNLYAIRIESAILQTQRVKFQQWPVINFGLSNPPLYTSSGNSGISVDDFTMFSGVSKSLDVNDIGGRESIRSAEYRLKFARGQLLLSMEREAARIYQIRAAYGQLLKDEQRLESALKRFNRPASGEAEAVFADLQLRSELEMQLIQARRQIVQLDLQYIIWDERFWKS